MTIRAGGLITPTDYLRDLATSTSSSAGFTTTETVTDTLTVSLVSGGRYKVTWDCAFVSTVAGDVVLPRLREDNLTGTLLQGYRTAPLNPANGAVGFHIEAYYTAAANGSKTFVGTAVRSSGTGTVNRFGSATLPSNMSVEAW